MADPRPARPGAAGIVDRIKKLELAVSALQAPSGTQRVAGVDQLAAAYAYLASLKTYGSAGLNSTTWTPSPAADSTVRWAWIGSTGKFGAQSHFIDELYVPTDQLLIEASCGEASITPPNSSTGTAGRAIAYVSYQVLDANDLVVRQYGNKTGRLYVGQSHGAGISTGATLLQIDRTLYVDPLRVVLYVGCWGYTDLAAQAFLLTLNTPSLRVEVVGEGI